ncbi:hypothetical protein KKH13_01645, partial [Patescibacteria group bacterium]|nr:hypothetical protein [Patescibacteria group bacterium]
EVTVLDISAYAFRRLPPAFRGTALLGNGLDEDTLKKSYHLKSCRDYDRVVIDRDRGEEFFCTEKEAQAAGFAKAYGCE